MSECTHECDVCGVCYNQVLHKSIEDGLPRKFADCVFVSSVINKRSFERSMCLDLSKISFRILWQN